MKEIIKLIVKYHFTIVFILLELGAFSLIVMHNNYQRTVFSGWTVGISHFFSSTAAQIEGYFHLQEENRRLVAENTALNNQMELLKRQVSLRLAVADSVAYRQDSLPDGYTFQAARMIHTSCNKTKNYITLDKGTEDGVATEMAVCGSEGVVGIVEQASAHYARVLPLINTNLRISAKIKKSNYYGSLQWDGRDYRYTYLNDIPFHVEVAMGDTIVTSGFSYIFPEGKIIGFVESVDRHTSNFLTIKVKLATDFKRISNVYVITNHRKEEQQSIGGVL